MTSFLLFATIFLAPAHAQETPNIVFVDICSARADHFSVYGYSRDTTPEIKKLAKESVVFDRAMAQSSWCRPNYASLFTGNTPEVHGMYTNRPGELPWFEVPLAERLKKAGYLTAGFSGGIYLLPEFGLTRGFDLYVNLFSTSTASRVPASADETIGPALKWARERKKGPFFLYLAVDDLHVPYHSDDPEIYDPVYDGPAHSSATLSIPFYRAYNGEPSGFDEAMRAAASQFKKDPRHLKHLIAHYDAALRHVDSQVGRLVRELRKSGLWDKTIFIVSADHGEMLGEHGLLGHTEGLYEPVLHVPLIVHDPAAAGMSGKRLSQLIERIDLAPTLLDMAGVGYDPSDFQGRSFLPLMQDRSAAWRSVAFAASKRDLARMPDLNLDERVARTERWKLHHYLYKDRYELYDLVNDPLETKDVSVTHPDILSTLSYELIRYMETNRPHAPGPVTPNYDSLTPVRSKE